MEQSEYCIYDTIPRAGSVPSYRKKFFLIIYHQAFGHGLSVTRGWIYAEMRAHHCSTNPSAQEDFIKRLGVDTTISIPTTTKVDIFIYLTHHYRQIEKKDLGMERIGIQCIYIENYCPANFDEYTYLFDD